LSSLSVTGSIDFLAAGRRLVMTNAKASPNLQALPTSPSPAQSLPSDAVLEALKMMLIGASLSEF
jgi:hypothetical protein